MWSHVSYHNIMVCTAPNHLFPEQSITRALQSTYPARYICMYLWAAGAASIYMYVFCWRTLPTYARWVVHMSRKHMACSNLSRRGRKAWPTKSTVCDTHGPCQRNRSILKPVFHWCRRIHCTYESLRCLDLEMWQFSCRRQTTDETKPIALSLAHVRGVIKSTWSCFNPVHIWTFGYQLQCPWILPTTKLLQLECYYCLLSHFLYLCTWVWPAKISWLTIETCNIQYVPCTYTIVSTRVNTQEQVMHDTKANHSVLQTKHQSFHITT